MRWRLVEFWSDLFLRLRWFSPWEILKKLRPEIDKKPINVEYYVSINLMSSICFSLVVCVVGLRWLGLLLFCWAWIRVFEVFVYQTNVLLFDGYRAEKTGKKPKIESIYRLVVLLLMNYGEIIFWFAIIYYDLKWFSLVPSGINLNSFLESINFSFVTMTTFGYTTVSPQHALEIVITLIQSAAGLFMALLVLARFISLLPSETQTSEDE